MRTYNYDGELVYIFVIIRGAVVGNTRCTGYRGGGVRFGWKFFDRYDYRVGVDFWMGRGYDDK